MFLTNLKMTAAIVVGSCILGGGVALWHYSAWAGHSTEVAPVDAWFGEGNASSRAQDSAARPTDQTPPRKEFDNAPGWRWFFSPCPPASRDMAERGMVCLIDRDKDGAQIVYLAYSGTFDRSHPEYRPVLFDAEGKRYVAEPDRGGSTGKFGKQVSMVRFRLDPKQLRQEKVTEIGVEQR